MSRVPAVINYLKLLYSIKGPSKNDDAIRKYLINICHIILVQLKEFNECFDFLCNAIFYKTAMKRNFNSLNQDKWNGQPYFWDLLYITFTKRWIME